MNDAARGNIPTSEESKEEVEVKQPVVEPLNTLFDAPTVDGIKAKADAYDSQLDASESKEAEPTTSATTEKKDKPKGDTVTSTTEIKDEVRTTVYKKYNRLLTQQQFSKKIKQTLII